MRRGHFVLVVAALVLILVAVAIRLAGPSPKPSSAPPGEFSAARARSVLDGLLREQLPHPVGSPANQVVRDRIVSRFQALGYETAIQRTFVCNARPTCATVENIIAKPSVIPSVSEGPGGMGGTKPRPTPRSLTHVRDDTVVFVAAHYDSVAAGPGASDDGIAVAALLEIARAIKGEQFKHPIAFLVTDGEEPGLLGAEAFVADRQVSGDVHAIVNVDNRGTSGASFLFETSRGNGELISAARAIKRPFASSLFYTIYDQLPNDTDATVFKRAGMRVLNVAAIGGVAYYHTPLDNLANVDDRTLQHHGDNALAAARALACRDLGTSPNAVYFDVLGLGIVQWPQPWTLPIIGVSFVVLLVLSRGSRLRDVILGFLLFIGSVVVAAVVGFALSWLAILRGGAATWVAYPQAVVAAMWLSGIAAAIFIRWLMRNADARAIFIGLGIAWHASTIAAALLLPGVSHLFLVPAVACTLCVRANELTRALVCAIAAAILFFPIGFVLYTALGKTSLVPIAVLITLVATSLPLTNGRVVAATFGAAILWAFIAMMLPTYTRKNPRRAPITLTVPASIDISARREGARLILRLRSRRNADQVALTFPGGTRVLRVNGVVPAPQNPRRAYKHDGAIVYGSEAVIELHAPNPIEVTASDIVFAPQKRNEADVVTSGRGDVIVSTRKATY